LIPFGRSFDAVELKAVNIAACCIKPVRQSALLDCLVQVLARSTSTGATFRTEPFIRSDDFPKPRSERVLLAEDNVVNQEVALGNLRKLGYNVDVVANGFEVLDALKRKRYDIILMDCQMPELDGYKTTKEIRRSYDVFCDKTNTSSLVTTSGRRREKLLFFLPAMTKQVAHHLRRRPRQSWTCRSVRVEASRPGLDYGS
jgi:CheY-like chemotaxis protein